MGTLYESLFQLVLVGFLINTKTVPMLFSISSLLHQSDQDSKRRILVRRLLTWNLLISYEPESIVTTLDEKVVDWQTLTQNRTEHSYLQQGINELRLNSERINLMLHLYQCWRFSYFISIFHQLFDVKK